jgi:hypothetical protein
VIRIRNLTLFRFNQYKITRYKESWSENRRKERRERKTALRSPTNSGLKPKTGRKLSFVCEIII